MSGSADYRSSCLRPFVILAAAFIATSANLSCQITPAPVSPGWQDYVGQLAKVSDAPADPDLLVPLSCRYRVLVEESFTTLKRTPAEAFVLERGGALGEIDGEPWIIGSSDGSESYVPYYRTDPCCCGCSRGSTTNRSLTTESSTNPTKDSKRFSTHPLAARRTTGCPVW